MFLSEYCAALSQHPFFLQWNKETSMTQVNKPAAKRQIISVGL